MLFAKLKGIALGVMTVGAIITGAVLAQDPTPTPKLAAPGGDYTITGKPSDPDRLRAVEQKLDRILEALGGARHATPTPYIVSAAPDLMPAAAVATARFAPQAGYSSTPAIAATTPAPAATTVTHFESADRLLTMERRLADVERRLRELERRLNAAHAPSALPSTSTGPQPEATATTVEAEPM
jgi:hypothetical protein